MIRYYLACMLAIFIQAAVACENKKDSIAEVALLKQPDHFSVYYRMNGYVLFIEPKVILANILSLQKQTMGGPNFYTINLEYMYKHLSSSIPLKENFDLYKFNFPNPYYSGLLTSMANHAMETGNAAIVDEGGIPVNKIFIKINYYEGSIFKQIHADEVNGKVVSGELVCIEN